MPIKRFVQAWQDFQANPELDVTKRGVVSAGQRFTKVIRDTAIEIQKLTNETGRAIESDITEANRLLREISRNNAAATRSRINGDSVGVAENQRDRALRDLSTILQVQTSTDEFGVVSVYSRSGSLLVGSSGVRELEYNSANREIKIIGGDIALASNAANNLPAGSLRAHFELIRDGAANTLSTKPETALYAKYSLMLDSLVDGLTNLAVADSLNATFSRHNTNVPPDLFFNADATRFDIQLNAGILDGTVEIPTFTVQTEEEADNILNILQARTRSITSLSEPVMPDDVEELPEELRQTNRSYQDIINGIVNRVATHINEFAIEKRNANRGRRRIERKFD